VLVLRGGGAVEAVGWDNVTCEAGRPGTKHSRLFHYDEPNLYVSIPLLKQDYAPLQTQYAFILHYYT
jgi:hypothetical protein